MKRLSAIITALCLTVAMLFGTVVFAEADDNRKINRLLAFGDSVVFGDSKIWNPMNDQKCGDQQFANLIAQEYGLTYIRNSSDTTTTGRWYRKYARNGAIMKNEEYFNANYGSILNQVTNCPDAIIAAADTIVMDGGINDVCHAVGINVSNKGVPQGTDKDIQSYSLEEMKTFIDNLKNMTEADGYYTWQDIKKNIVDGYKEVMDTLLAKGFSGTIYMQNNINPFAEGKESDDSNKMVYYWDSMINYFITDSINTTIAAYPAVDIKLVDLCKELRYGTTYTGHYNTWDSPDNLHLTFSGNQAVYKYYSKLFDENADTLDVGEDTIPSGASWRVLTTFDDFDLSKTNGELISVSDAGSIISSGTVAEEYLLKVTGSAKIDLSEFDFSNIYGIRARVANAYGGDFFSVDFYTDSKQLYWSNRNGKSLDYMGIFSNGVVGDRKSQFGSTIGRNRDFQKIEYVTLGSGHSDDTVYIDDIEVYTTDTSLPSPDPSEKPIVLPEGFYDAADATLSGGATTNTNHTGYTGKGFVDNFGKVGSSITFNVNVEEAGNYTLDFRYANACGDGKDARPTLYIDGNKIKDLTFTENGKSSLANYTGWNYWSNNTEVSTDLTAGAHTIKIIYDTASYSSNVDGLTLIKNSDMPSDTTAAPTTAAPTTAAPTTAAPTTAAPTTVAPTTVAPTTAAPTTVAPTTAAPTTVAPTTAAPTTVAPTTAAPTTVAPTTAAPTTATPTTTEPTTTITPIIYGDTNSDGNVNLLDLILMRKYLAKWSVEIDTAAADCNADGNINLLDLILMRKYLAKWNVVLGPQK
ncbi:MAG: dockerin type I domain-containing protein [Acutalibacteraceae bacterium]